MHHNAQLSMSNEHKITKLSIPGFRACVLNTAYVGL